MDIWVKDANSFRQVIDAWVHDGTTFRNVAQAWVHDGTDWRKVYFKFTTGFQPTLGGSFSTIYNAPDYTWSVYSHLTVKTDGTVRVWWEWNKHSGGVPINVWYTTEWWGRWGSPPSTGVGSNYYIKYTELSIDSNYTARVGGLSLNTWYPLTEERDFGIFFSGPWGPTHGRHYTLHLSTSASDAGIVHEWSDWIYTNFNTN